MTDSLILTISSMNPIHILLVNYNLIFKVYLPGFELKLGFFCTVGKGTYGNVFRCVRKIDMCSYAVKEVGILYLFNMAPHPA